MTRAEFEALPVMSKSRKREGRKPRQTRGKTVRRPCPRCGRDIRLRGLSESCYSGECGQCLVEWEMVDNGGNGTWEAHPMHGLPPLRPEDDEECCTEEWHLGDDYGLPS